MNSGMTRWKTLPLYPSPSGVSHSALKLATVFGVTVPKRPRTTLPACTSSTVMSKYTLSVTSACGVTSCDCEAAEHTGLARRRRGFDCVLARLIPVIVGVENFASAAAAIVPSFLLLLCSVLHCTALLCPIYQLSVNLCTR